MTPARLLVLVAVVLFVLAGLGVPLATLGQIDLIAIGLAFGFASFLV